MKIDKSRRIMFFVSLIGIVVVTLIMGTTFAYQTLVVNYKEGSDNDTVVEAGKLNVSYENNNKRTWSFFDVKDAGIWICSSV